MEDPKAQSRADIKKAKNARRREERDRKIDEVLSLTPGLTRSDVHGVRRELRRLGWRRVLVMMGVTALFVAACVVVGVVILKWP